jgi:hypothetical protein
MTVSILDRVPGQTSWCWTSVPQRRRKIIQHASLDHVSSEDIVWKIAIKAVDIQWVGRPFVSRLKHAGVALYRARATKGDFWQAVLYVLDNEEENEFKRLEAVEIVPLIITKPGNTQQPARFHMRSLLLERINLADGQAKYRRKGYADFISTSDCTD